ncbi:MAG: hypothetical protein DSY57_01295, partial [Desulfobulbus sp.]
MSTLSPYFSKKILARLNLTATTREYADKLVALIETDNRINVKRIHEELFPFSTTANANSSLNRLIHTLNEAAEKNGINLEVKITASKQGGAAKRWVWFEGPLEAPPTYTEEIQAIPAEQLITNQRGLPANDLPVIILLTFNINETTAVINRFHPRGRPATETRNGTDYNLLGIHGGNTIVHRISQQGEGKAQNAAHNAIIDWNPKAIIGVGIAFGVNPDKQEIGDVLVSTSVRDYELRRVNENGTITPRGPNPPASSLLIDRFRHTDHTSQADTTTALHWPAVKFGPILSGNSLVDNVDYRDSLVQLEPNSIGGEMEGLGIHLATERSRTDWLIVKAICDWGDGNIHTDSKEDNQRCAARNAALVVHQALSL